MNEPGQALAFGRGCDARIAGYSLRHNPYPPESDLSYCWRHGWNHVSLFWGVDDRKAEPLAEILL